MKKIGIITFHTALNYGAVLQAYALQNFLKKNEMENEILNYDCPFIKKCYSPFFVPNKKYFSALIRGVLFSNIIKKKRKKFENFICKNLNVSNKFNNIEGIKKIKNNYSYFLTGSDQVWSPVAADFDPMYFLPFAKQNQKYSYAASIGTSKLNKETEHEMKKRLKDFEIISVREENAKNILEELAIGKEIFTNVDPTFLLEKQDWLNLVGEDEIKDKYLLIFNVEKPIHAVEYAKQIAKERGLKIVYINDRTIIKDKEIIYFQGISPEKFLTLFYHSEMVVTNSFHGTVFSIIMNKQFLVELENKKLKNMRVENLLNKLDIQNRVICLECIQNMPCEPDWNKVNEKIDKERQKSLNYLNYIKNDFREKGNV